MPTRKLDFRLKAYANDLCCMLALAFESARPPESTPVSELQILTADSVATEIAVYERGLDGSDNHGRTIRFDNGFLNIDSYWLSSDYENSLLIRSLDN